MGYGVPGDGSFAPSSVAVAALIGAAIANIARGIVDDGIASLGKVAIAGGLIAVGGHLIAVGGILVDTCCPLVSIRARLIAVRKRPIVIGHGLTGLRVFGSRGVYRMLPFGRTVR